MVEYVKYEETVGGRLRLCIDRLGITQREFSKRAGMSEYRISQYINNRHVPDADALLKIYYNTGMSIDELLCLNPAQLGTRMRTCKKCGTVVRNCPCCGEEFKEV